VWESAEKMEASVRQISKTAEELVKTEGNYIKHLEAVGYQFLVLSGLLIFT